MKAVIMAGGLGERLKPLTCILPKPLLPVGERSVLEITVQKLREHGFDDIVLAVNYKSELFESYFGDGSRFGVRITYTKEEKRLGTAGPLLLARELLAEPFLVVNGDILTDVDFRGLREFHTVNKADFTIVTKRIQLPLHYGVVEKMENRVVDIREKPTVEAEISAGIYFLDPGVLAFIPPDTAFSMVELVKALTSAKKKVLSYVFQGYWLDIGHMKDYERAQEDMKRGLI